MWRPGDIHVNYMELYEFFLSLRMKSLHNGSNGCGSCDIFAHDTTAENLQSTHVCYRDLYFVSPLGGLWYIASPLQFCGILALKKSQVRSEDLENHVLIIIMSNIYHYYYYELFSTFCNSFDLHYNTVLGL